MQYSEVCQEARTTSKTDPQENDFFKLSHSCRKSIRAPQTVPQEQIQALCLRQQVQDCDMALFSSTLKQKLEFGVSITHYHEALQFPLCALRDVLGSIFESTYIFFHFH